MRVSKFRWRANLSLGEKIEKLESMAKFLTNPRSLTKDRLKSELEANGVALPKGDQRKQVYIDLYLEHLTSQNEQLDNDGADDRMFSSDEEDDSKSSPKVSQILQFYSSNLVLVRK